MAKSQYSKKVLEIATMLDVPKSVVDKIRRIKKERPDLLEQYKDKELWESFKISAEVWQFVWHLGNDHFNFQVDLEVNGLGGSGSVPLSSNILIFVWKKPKPMRFFALINRHSCKEDTDLRGMLN